MHLDLWFLSHCTSQLLILNTLNFPKKELNLKCYFYYSSGILQRKNSPGYLNWYQIMKKWEKNKAWKTPYLLTTLYLIWSHTRKLRRTSCTSKWLNLIIFLEINYWAESELCEINKIQIGTLKLKQNETTSTGSSNDRVYK